MQIRPPPFKPPEREEIYAIAYASRLLCTNRDDSEKLGISHALAWAIGERADPPIAGTGLPDSEPLQPSKEATNDYAEKASK